jgi:hypothetical protein
MAEPTDPAPPAPGADVEGPTCQPDIDGAHDPWCDGNHEDGPTVAAGTLDAPASPPSYGALWDQYDPPAAPPDVEGQGREALLCLDEHGPYTCNRLSGHDGDHVYSMPYASWTT